MKEIWLVGAVVVLGVAGGRLGFPAGGLVLALVGGLTGIATVAVETGANAPVTVLFNLVRLVAILVVLPLIAVFWSRP